MVKLQTSRNWTPVIEAGKEVLREILIAAIPGILTYLGTLNTTWAAVLYLLLRALDKFLHEKNSKNFVTNFLKLDF